MTPTPLYKAFVSYSHSVGGSLAPSLQASLERFGKPWFRTRAFRLFRDTTNLSASPELWPDIQEALHHSEFLLLLASPEAAGSKWVRRELSYWRDHKDLRKILIVLTAGTIEWREEAVDFDWERTTALPRMLEHTFGAEPLYVDFRGIDRLSLDDERFLDNIATLGARLHGTSKDLIYGEHIRQHRKTMRLVATAIVSLLVLLVSAIVAGVTATRQYRLAERRALIATGQRLATESRLTVAENPQRSALLAVASLDLLRQNDQAFVPDAEDALRSALLRLGGRGVAGLGGALTSMAMSPDGRWLATDAAESVARLWDWHLPDPAAHGRALEHPGGAQVLTMSEDGRWLVTAGNQSELRLWDLSVSDSGNAVRPLRGHATGITALAISRDSRWLASAGADRTLRIWDLSSTDVEGTALVARPVEPIKRIAMSGDGRWIAGILSSDRVVLWERDAIRKSPAGRALTHDGPAYAAVFSLDNRRLIAGGSNPSEAVLIWDLGSIDAPGRPNHSLRGHKDTVYALAVASTNGRQRLVTAGADQRILVWDISGPLLDSRPVATLTGHRNRIRSLATSGNGEWLVSGSDDGTTRVWDIAKPDRTERVKVLRGHELAVTMVAISHDGRFVASGGNDATARFWDLALPDRVASPKQVEEPYDGRLLNAVALSADQRWLTAARFYARMLDLSAENPFQPRDQVSEHVEFGVRSEGSIALASSNGRWIVTGGELSAELLDLSSRFRAAPAPLSGVESVERAVITPDSRWLITEGVPSSEDPKDPDRLPTDEELEQIRQRRVQVWDLTKPSPAEAPAFFLTHPDRVNALDLSPDGRWLISGADDSMVRVWDLGAANPPATLRSVRSAHESINAIAMSPDGRWLAVSSEVAFKPETATIELFDLSSRTQHPTRQVLQGPSGTTSKLLFSRDGRWLGAIGSSSVVRLWDLIAAPSPEPARLLQGHEDEVLDFTLSRDSRWCVTGSRDGTARVWDLTAGQPEAVRVLRERGSVAFVGVSANNRWLVTGSPVSQTIDLSEDGVVGTETDTSSMEVRVWHLQLDDLLAAARATVGRNFKASEWQRYFPGQPYRPIFPQFVAPGK